MGYLLSSFDNTSTGFDFRISTSTAYGIFYDGGAYFGLQGTVPMTGKHVLAFTYDGSGVVGGMKMYIDNVPLTTVLSAGTVTDITSALNLFVGARPNLSGYTASGGTCLNAKYFPVALTPQQISILHRKLLKELNV